MQILNFKSKSWQVLGILLMGAVIFTGCKKDDSTADTGGGSGTPAEDGFYVIGSGSAFDSPSISGNFSIARNEVRNPDYNSGAIDENDRPTLMEGFFALNAGGSITIKQVSGADETTWGLDNVELIGAGTEENQPNVDFQRGDLVSGGSAITVPEDGLYHIAFDTEIAKMIVVPVSHWGLIGAATPGGWTTDTELPLQSFNTSEMVFTLADIEMTVADWKFRYANGWKVILDADYDNGGSLDPGIKLNSNFGTAVDNLVPGGDNMTNSEAGIYTATMTWTPGGGFEASMVKTDDLPIFDYSSTELGLVGAGLNFSGAAHNWDETVYVQTPSAAGNVYTWDYPGVEVNISGGGFKIREGQTWDDLSFGYTAVNVSGSAASDFETNGDGNFVPLVDGGMYNMTFTIDAESDTKTFTIEPI